ncbi:MAG: TatD family hydrolase, partial [Alphaproteobacteria bacterium]|nr:TatD family hydrolase [Alphaproteobacteria bacterium]
MNKPDAKQGQKKGGLGAAFGAFSGVIDDIVNEVKQDLKEMTPAQKQPSAREKLLADADSRMALVSGAASGVSENTVEFQPAAAPPPVAAPSPAAEGLPQGNLWQALRNRAQQTALRTDAVYHALTPADVESYARAVANETKPPFTLGLLAANVAALSEEEMNEGAMPELLTQVLLQAIAREPRLFGALGAGPRQLWSSLDNLERFLLEQFNTHRKLIAVGPIGLDEPFAPYTLAQQQAQVALQLESAADFGMPALLSTRKTQERLAETLG